MWSDAGKRTVFATCVWIVVTLHWHLLLFASEVLNALRETRTDCKFTTLYSNVNRGIVTHNWTCSVMFTTFHRYPNCFFCSAKCDLKWSSRLGSNSKYIQKWGDTLFKSFRYLFCCFLSELPPYLAVQGRLLPPLPSGTCVCPRWWRDHSESSVRLALAQ